MCSSFSFHLLSRMVRGLCGASSRHPGSCSHALERGTVCLTCEVVLGWDAASAFADHVQQRSQSMRGTRLELVSRMMLVALVMAAHRADGAEAEPLRTSSATFQVAVATA